MEHNENKNMQEAQKTWAAAFESVGRVVVGQEDMVESLFMGLLTGGHVLLEGVPGLAKTLTVSTLAQVVDLGFSRIQFTPDLLPSDLVGTMIYSPKDQSFFPKKGPVFSNIVLADEINRSPAKVQSALLEAMAEKQVTLGDTAYKLEEIFLVLATQNPLEQEGTYPLPEAQMDRFMFKVMVDYPSKEEEKVILDRMSTLEKPQSQKCLTLKQVLDSQALVDQIFVDERLKDYIVDLVVATREPQKYGLSHLGALIEVGVSPRATLSLVAAAKCKAFFSGKTFVDIDDIKSVAYKCLRHRLILNYEAQAESITTENVISEVLSALKVS